MKAIRAVDTWARAGVYYVRTEAMVFGFNVSLQGEFDTDAPDTEYVLVLDDEGKPVSTCRIHAVFDKGYAKIERVATVSGARNQGAGRLAIQEAERWIREKGISKVVVTSRDEAVGFYEKLGYKPDYSVDCRKMFSSPEKENDDDSPGFTVVYTEKELD